MAIELRATVNDSNSPDDAPVAFLLQDVDGRVDALIEKHHTQELFQLLCPNAAVNVNRGNNVLIHNYGQLPVPKINQIVIPTGATRWSYGLLLATTKIKDAAYKLASKHNNKLNLHYSARRSDETDDTVETKHELKLTVSLLPARSITPMEHKEIDTNSSELWIVPVVDQRYWWQFLNTGALADSLDLGAESEMTPDDLITSLVGVAGSSYLEPLGENPAGPPPSYTWLYNVRNIDTEPIYDKLPTCSTTNDYENVPIVLDSVLAHYGQRLVVDIGHSDGEETIDPDPPFSLIASTKNIPVTRFATVDGENSTYIYDKNVEGKVGLWQPKWNDTDATLAPVRAMASGLVDAGEPLVVGGFLATEFPQVFGTDVKPNVDFSELHEAYKYYSAPESVQFAVDGTTEFTTRTASSQAYRYPTQSGVTHIWRLSWLEKVTDEAIDQIAKDYYWQFARMFDVTFAGVQLWQQTIWDDYMVFRQTYNEKTERYDVFTRVCSRQPNMIGEWVRNGDTELHVFLGETLEGSTSARNEATSVRCYVYYPSKKRAHTVSISGSPTGGTYTLTFVDDVNGTRTTGAIARNATGTTVQTAIRALSGLSTAVVKTTGTSPNVTHKLILNEENAFVTVSGTSSMTGGSPALTIGESFAFGLQYGHQQVRAYNRFTSTAEEGTYGIVKPEGSELFFRWLNCEPDEDWEAPEEITIE